MKKISIVRARSRFASLVDAGSRAAVSEDNEARWSQPRYPEKDH